MAMRRFQSFISAVTASPSRESLTAPSRRVFLFFASTPNLPSMTELDRLRALLRTTTVPAARTAIVERMRVTQIKEEKQSRIDALKTQIRTCRNCDLGYQRKHAVPFTGPIDGKADLILVGEAPGNTEDRMGEPFVGWAGEMLDHLLLSAGTSREKCFILNAIACIPREGKSFREPAQEELDACRPNFHDQLEISGCKVGVALGGYAWGAVRNLPREMIKVKSLLHQAHWIDGRIWIVTYHPSYARRHSGLSTNDGQVIEYDEEKQVVAQEVVKSLQWALAMAKGETTVPKIPWERVRFAGKYHEELGAAIKKKGWALFDSPAFGCQIVIADDSRGSIPKLPISLEQIPVYTINELLRLGMFGAEKGMTVGDLRRLHYVKVEMEGEVVYDGYE